MPRISFATSHDYPELDGELHLVEHFARRGYDTSIDVWNDQSVDWNECDFVIIRSCYDFTEMHDDFLGWIERVRRQTVLLNSPDVLIWNSHKSYLFGLHKHNIPMPELAIVEAVDQLAEITSSLTGNVVIKPCVGGSGKGVRLFGKLNEDALTYARQLLSHGDVLIQAFAPEVADGEISAVFFANRFSHAVRKVPPRGEYRTNWKYGARPKRLSLPDDDITKLQQIYQQAGVDTLYARVDVVEQRGSFQLLELETLDPYLYIEGHDDLAEKFVDAFEAYTDTTLQ